MFQYNRFWHFWFQLNNRHYSRISLVSLLAFLLLIPAALFFPPLWGLVVALPLAVTGVIALFTQLSNFFYNRQNQRLSQLQAEASDETLNDELELYLNRRVVCPQELLTGTHLNLPHDMPQKSSVVNPPLILETEDTFTTNRNNNQSRNPGMRATGVANQLYIKTVAAKDGLSEVAAREMAEILGFEDLIPANTIAKTDVLYGHNDRTALSNEGLVLSRQKIKTLIDSRREESTGADIQNTVGVQNAVAQFIFNLKTAAYRTKAQEDGRFKLVHVQKLVPNATDGLQVYTQLFNEPVVQPGQFFFGGLSVLMKNQQRAAAKHIIQRINLYSFQEHFLLSLILGSQDANPGNTLFSDESGEVLLYSIDHERIMPEDNYNITKKIPVANGADVATSVEKDVENVFPIRLWLAGLPQANVPFSKEVIEKTLALLNLERLLAYHHHKKLFSPAAVGAQLDRVLLIKKLFAEENKKSQITLTPKELFLELINNHPSYLFLKNNLGLSDFHTFALLGQVPEGADMSLLRHPLQWFSMLGMLIEAQQNEQQGRPSFSDESFKSSHAHNLLFFSIAAVTKQTDEANKAGLDILTEISNQFS